MTPDSRNIVLTGFMGTGKSSVGRYVAARLRRPFVDMDALIEERQGQTVAAIFAVEGETTFRRYESDMVHELTAQTGLVIATGGGALVNPANREALLATGAVICLQADADEVLRRVGSNGTRPLLNVENPRQHIEHLLTQRAPAYGAIPLQLDTLGLSVAAVGERVIALALGLVEGECFALPVHAPGADYTIIIGDGVLARLPALLTDLPIGATAALVTNDTLAPLHSATVMQALRAGGLAPRLCTMPDGESFKTLDTVRDLYAQFAQAELERQSAVIALGGGVVGDTAGFAAATYLRGLPFIQMPTTLLSMVDASVGGKVGVDLPGVGKNLVGAFKQPLLVLADTALLATLPPAEFRAGLAEVVKHGILAAPALFVDLEGVGPRSLPHLIAEAVRVKVNVVEADPFEQHVRAHLNLGHTFAHALELVSDFNIRHGDAVAIGLAAAAHLGVALGACDDALRDRIVHLLARLGLPVRIPASFTASAQQLLVAMGSDKKKKEGRLRFIIPRRIGQVEIFDHVPPALVLAAWREVGV